MEFKQLSPLLHPKPNNWLRLERRRIYILSICICSTKIVPSYGRISLFFCFHYAFLVEPFIMHQKVVKVNFLSYRWCFNQNAF